MVAKTVLSVLKNVGLVAAGAVAGGITVGVGVKGLKKAFQKPVAADEDIFEDDDDFEDDETETTEENTTDAE